MGKKSKRNRSKPISAETAARPKDERRAAPALRTSAATEETRDNLRFEDPFVEEFDEDEGEWSDNEEDAGEGGGIKQRPSGVGVNDGEDMEIVQSWNPLTGEALRPGEKLEMDPAAYKMHHALTSEWPALSFDFLRDDLGESRTRFPHSLIAAVGTQADRPEHNKLMLLKISDLSKMQVETEDDILGDEFNPDKDQDGDDDDDDSESSEEEIDLDPVMEHYSINHYGGVNRVRAMPQRPDIVATWSDAGRVNLFDVESIRHRFSIGSRKGGAAISGDIPSKPFFSYTKHNTEGYAMDWNPVQEGHLVTGDCNGSIHLWTPRPEGGGYLVVPFHDSGHSADSARSSVEDLQWSPTEATVFSSAECGGYVRIFDTRAPQKAMLSHKVHGNGADVNVLSWNKHVANLLATGGDDGTLSVFDLRHFSKTSRPDPLARFTPHRTPITSVEWHPTDESMLAASDDVGAYIYDLSVEEDDQDTAAGQTDVPPQLLFVHCGSEQFKELHWHPQIPSCLMTTALTGFSVFIPSNL
jgi:ribosome assembly protein RRB1